MVIYKTTNLINGKIYIGQDTKNNPKYLGSGKILKHAMKKYGKDKFIKEIIETCENIDKLNEREKYWITELNSTNKEIGYNVTFGGQSGWMLGLKHTEDTKLNYSISRKGKLISEKNGMYGKKHTDESKKKMSNPKFGQDNGMYGKKHSEETKKKMSEIAKKRKRSPTSKKVVVGDLIFNSASEAALYFNISVGAASYRCRNNIKNWSWLI